VTAPNGDGELLGNREGGGGARPRTAVFEVVSVYRKPLTCGARNYEAPPE